MSTKPKHTPGPWRIKMHVSREVLGIFQDGDRSGKYLATAHIKGSFVESGEANAARIVACVNACEGMADPAETLALMRDLMSSSARQADGLLNANAAIQAQRDELAEALKRIIQMIEGEADKRLEGRKSKWKEAATQAVEEAYGALNGCRIDPAIVHAEGRKP